MRFPIILPKKKSWVTTLRIFHQHTEGANTDGANHILAALSGRYWIISAREVIREVERACYECRRRNRKTAQQIMAPLPSGRAKIPSRAFVHSAVDVGGPFITSSATLVFIHLPTFESSTS